MPEFVIQKHTHKDNPEHWDMMLRQDDALLTWRIGIPPEKIGGDPFDAEKISDHPLKFLIYQGMVNSGKGNVEIADAGEYEVLAKTNNRIKISMTGKIIRGVIELVQIENSVWRIEYQPFVQR